MYRLNTMSNGKKLKQSYLYNVNFFTPWHRCVTTSLKRIKALTQAIMDSCVEMTQRYRGT